MERIEFKNKVLDIIVQARKEKNQKVILAKLGRKSLFFLLTHLLNRKDADNDFVFERCLEVEKNPDGYLDLWARSHYKSTIITFAKTIQDVLNNPEETIGIFSHTKSIARAFLSQIKTELQTNETLKEVYDDVLYSNPEKDSPRWSIDNGIIVKRKSNPKEATIEAWGLVDGQPTSRHYSKIIYDDVVTLESVTTPEQIKKTTDAWAMSLNLGSNDTVYRYIGTRYHLNDTYAEIMRRGAAIPRIIPATKDGKVEGETVFLSREQLDEKYKTMGSYIFGAQMLQNPIADEAQSFKPEWIQFWAETNTGNFAGFNKYILVDPAGEKKKGSDYTVMVVIGLGSDSNYYLIHGVRDRLNLTEKAKLLLQLHRDYQPVAVGYEKYGMQADVEYIKEVQGRENYHFKIIELGGIIPKNDRIRRLIPLFENGQFFLPAKDLFIDSSGKTQNFTSLFLNDEYSSFPVSLHDDMLDCIARIKDPELRAVCPENQLNKKLINKQREVTRPVFAKMNYEPFRR